MNAQNRRDLQQAIGLINYARTIVEKTRDEEQDKFDNMPESLQYSDKGTTMEEAVSSLDEALSMIDEAIDYIETASA